MGSSIETLAVISVPNTIPVAGARTTPAKNNRQCLLRPGSKD
jgi:hypothetical protein